MCWGGGLSEREVGEWDNISYLERERVCVDQLHSKSVYSAQFGIKHNRVLSACYCLWCPIKMEFIAALRANLSSTFFALLSSERFLVSWCWCRVRSKSSEWLITASQGGAVWRRASLPVITHRCCFHSHLTARLWWHLLRLSLSI